MKLSNLFFPKLNIQLKHLVVVQVTDDVPECRTVVEEKCEDDTSGFTSSILILKPPIKQMIKSLS